MRADVIALAACAALAAATGCGADPSRVEHDAAMVCATLVTEYAAAWPAAIACDPGSVGQCAALRREPLFVNGSLAGLGCDAVVNPAHVKGVDAVLARIDAAGCNFVPPPCPLVPALQNLPRRCPASGSCE